MTLPRRALPLAALPLALALVSEWLERAKANGTVRRALDAAGIAGPVAPPGSRFGG